MEKREKRAMERKISEMEEELKVNMTRLICLNKISNMRIPNFLFKNKNQIHQCCQVQQTNIQPKNIPSMFASIFDTFSFFFQSYFC